MEKSQLIALYTQDQRKDVVYPGLKREVSSNLVRHVRVSGAGELGFIMYSDLDETNADDVIREQIRYFEGIGQSFEWKVFDYDQPAPLHERLASHGFDVEEAEAILMLDLKAAPDFFWQPVSGDIRYIKEIKQLNDVLAVEKLVWNEDFSWLTEHLGDKLNNPTHQMSVYVAYVDEQPASAAWTYFSANSQFASLWGGSTVSEFRKQGLYSALLAIRAQEANARGVRFLTVDASPMSRPILEKFGFELIAYSYPCKWEVK